MPEEKIRVDFKAPKSLVERVDSVAEVLGVSRTRLVIKALERKLETLAEDDTFRRRLGEAYYDDRVDYDTVEAVLGREEAMRMQLLRSSFDRSAPTPQLDGDLPSDEAFYEDGVAEWPESNAAGTDDESST